MDPDNPFDLFALHCVFLDDLNKRLAIFKDTFNQAPNRKMENKSPSQIFFRDAFKFRNSSLDELMKRKTPRFFESFPQEPGIPMVESGQNESDGQINQNEVLNVLGPNARRFSFDYLSTQISKNLFNLDSDLCITYYETFRDILTKKIILDSLNES